MKGLRLYKKEKLCSTVAIEQLFMRGGEGVQGALAYPLRAVWRQNPRRSSDAPVAFVVSIPKKRLRHAVDRVQMRRRVREAYRLARPAYPMPDGTRLDVAFIYVADKMCSYRSVEKAMAKLMTAISGSQCKEGDE
ncbi:MAG: ribonuclease P protein component [Muribaculaceae bacterium]|nr:ribonuclease P protein component [Muribaculaceae bacterium]